MCGCVRKGVCFDDSRLTVAMKVVIGWTACKWDVEEEVR